MKRITVSFPCPLLALLGLLAVLAVLAVLGLAVRSSAAPTGEVVIEGHAEFIPDGNTTIINTTTEQTIVEYDSFDVLPDEIVQINQPTDESRILNHIPHGDPTHVDGSVYSNGFVYIVNPAGLFIGGEAIIDVGGLVAAAGKLDYEDFLAGQDRFTELSGDVRVEAGAEITADHSVALLGRRVANFGAIVAQGGMVAFVAGDNAVLGSLDGHLIVRVDGTGEALPPEEGFALTQGGSVDVGAGSVVLSAGDTYSLAMNHTGVTRGRDILLEAGGEGLVQVAGTLDASDLAAGGTGGSVRVLGDRVAVLDARIDASGDAGGGEILVGGDAHGAGDVPTADRTYVGPSAELVADAITEGDGGKIVVWAEEKAGFYGHASARGGAQGGNGGFVEISGRQFLDTGGHTVDLSAPNGQSGTLLYDPNEILIMGGTDDGSDDDGDPAGDPLDLNDGTPGQILAGDVDDEPFVIYESEIEGTDADIVLQALQRIRVSGTFDGNDVIIVPGNSLVVQTTGDPNLGPLELFAIDLGSDLTWKVSDGGVFYISTAAGDLQNLQTSPSAGINVGTLEWERAYSEEVVEGLRVAQPIGVDLFSLGIDAGQNAVTILTQVGDIRIGEIHTSGADAAAGGTQLAAAGGNVFVGAQSGQVEVGSIQAKGGSAVAPGDPEGFSPTNGGSGGNVTVSTNDGSVRVRGGIDTSGGDGLAGIVDVPDDEDDLNIQGNGGLAGAIRLASVTFGETPTSLVVVTGDLLARGGSGEGFITVPAESGGSVPLRAVGGSGGSIVVTADNGIFINDSLGSRIQIDASGGDGTLVAGDARDAFESITLSVPEQSEFGIETTGVQLQGVDLRANGGDAIAGGSGGLGGFGGSVLINGGAGAVLADDVTIEANGGDGADGPPGDFLVPGDGGDARTIRIIGDVGVSFTGGSTIEASGGAGVNGIGGHGGSVDIDSQLGDIVVGDVTVNGGDAVQGFADPQPVAGGPGGLVSLMTGDFGSLAGDPETGGDIFLSGQITGLGGSGVDADDAVTHASGTTVELRSNGTIGAAFGADPGIQAGTISLTAETIGSGDPIDLAGTQADDDQAFLSTDGSIEVNLLALPGNGIEDVTVTHTSALAETTLTNAGAPMLEVVAAVQDDDETILEPQTLQLMQTVDGDPALHFVLDAVEQSQGVDGSDLRIDRGAAVLGSAGGSISNDDGAIVVVEDGGGAPHITVTGDPDPEIVTVLALTGTSIGSAAAPIEIDGDGDAALGLDARGDVYVDVIDPIAGGALEGFGAIELTLNAPTAQAHIVTSDDSSESIDVTDASGGDELNPVSLLTGSTVETGSDFAFHQTALAASIENANAPRVDIRDLSLGGNGLVSATGDVRLIDADGASVVFQSGNALVLDAGGDVVWTQPGAGTAIEQQGNTAPSQLVLLATRGTVGSSDGGDLVTTGVADSVLEIAGRADGDFRLRNEGGGQVVITEIAVQDPRDVSGETSTLTVTGIRTSGLEADVEIGNEDRSIVLGAIDVGSPNTDPRHVDATGDVVFHSAVEIENAQYVLTPAGGGTGEVEAVAVNGAGVFAEGNVVFEDTIDTSMNATAVDDVSESDPEPDLFVNAALTVEAGGSVSYAGDVGGQTLAGEPTGALARLDTTDALLVGAGIRTFTVGEAIFRGTLDGPAAAVVSGERDALTGDDSETSASFGGDIGVSSALGGLTVNTDQIAFAVAGGGSAERVVVDGDVLLDTGLSAGVDAIPAVATITDAVGNLRIEATNFAVGELDKLSAVGNLEIVAADTVRVGDLSAARIGVHAPSIEIMNSRGPGDVELPDGTFVTDMGTDWVANEIALSSAPVADDPGSPLRFFLGNGGISVPGGLGAIEVRRIDARLGPIAAADFFSQDGRMLDLTGSGPPVIGNPSRVTPRPVQTALPDAPPRFGDEPAAPQAEVDAAQTLAFLRCTGIHAGATSGPPPCTPDDEVALAGVRRFRDSVLATARAREIAARYHALVVSPGGVAQLRGAFATAGPAFGAAHEWRDGSLDGAEFYRFLAAAPREQRAALASVRELAWLFAQLELLALTDEDTRHLQRTLAQEFADAAALPGLSAETVTAAVDASPVGLVRD